MTPLDLSIFIDRKMWFRLSQPL